MGVVKNEACPSCRSIGRDSTGNHLMVFEDGNTFCSRCKYTTTSEGGVIKWGHLKPDETPVVTPESSPTESFSSSPESLPFDAIRSIPKDVVKLYGTHVEYDPATRDISYHYYPMTRSDSFLTYKRRDCETKDFITLKKIGKKPCDFFGKSTAKGKIPKILVLTEGELDAMAAYQMLKGIHPELYVWSLPTGANVTTIVEDLKLLQKIDEVYLAYDQDDAGDLAVAETWKLLPDVKVMEFSEKDPCEMLDQMKTGEFVDSFLTAEKYKPRTLVDMGSLIDGLADPVPKGLAYPWKSLNDITFGIHLNSIVGIGAAPKAGKSTLMKAIQFQLMFVHKVPIGIINVEAPAKTTLRELVGYDMGEKIHLPGVKYSVSKAQAVARKIQPLCNIYDHQYYNGTWQELDDVIRYLYISGGVRYFFLDPVSAVVSHLGPSEQNQWLSTAMFKMSKLVQQLDICVFHVNHLNSPATGLSHEAGGRIYGSSFTGSRSQYRYSHLLIGMERDQHADLPADRDVSTLRIIGDRLTGNTGKSCNLKYDGTTGRLNEIPLAF